MNARERILTALNHQVPDRLPFAFGYINPTIREAIIGEPLNYSYQPYRVDWSPVFEPGTVCRSLEPAESTDVRVARKLGLDALGFQLLTPVMARLEQKGDGRNVLAGGYLTPQTFDAFCAGLPDPDDERLYREAAAFVKRYQGEFALFCRIRLGFSPLLLSIGQSACLQYLETEPNFIKDVSITYSNWLQRHIKNLMECGFDFLWSFDDMADQKGPFFTSQQLEEFFLPYMRASAAHITVPWIFHSDGNLFPVLDDLLTLGMSGLHPLEPGTMDLVQLKRQYGSRLCLVGNLEIKHIMTDATSKEIHAYIDKSIETMAYGGGYILSDSNSVPAGVNPENIAQIADYVRQQRNIYERRVI